MKRTTTTAAISLLCGLCLTLPSFPSYASSGTEGASFLDIPVGAGPAAMGGAYSALADDAYAPTWNPGGLGLLDSTQLSGQHVSYLDTLHYEYFSAAVPLPRSSSCAHLEDCPGSALGASVQYLGSGDVNGMDQNGNPTGTFSNYYAAYNLAYGRALNDKLSLGLTGKMIAAKLDNVSASAYAADIGSMYRLDKNLTLAATVTNLGSKLTFLSEGDSLPMAFHVSGAYQATPHWLFAAEGVYPKTALAAFHAGVDWHPLDHLALRSGYRTDTVKGLSPLAGYSLGMGLNVWGQELGYAWVPYGELGTTHYFSLVMRFGEAEKAKLKLIQYQSIKTHRTVHNNGSDEMTPDYQQLMEILNDSDQHMAQQQKGPAQDQ
jgi:hypothetical protein